jgi:hypothetical protein
MIRGWERGDHELFERYELLYRRLGLEPVQPASANLLRITPRMTPKRDRVGRRHEHDR